MVTDPHGETDPQVDKESQPETERRRGPKDRRCEDEDRRNEDRVSTEIQPRRNPDQPDRRTT